MARMSHDLQDARKTFQSLVNLHLDRYARRLKQTGEDFITERYNEVVGRGGVWNHSEIAEQAWLYSQDVISGQGELEPGDVADAA